MVGVTYHVSAVPAEVVDAKTSVKESPVAVPVVVWHALHLQRTTSEHFDTDRSRTRVEVLSGTSGRAEQVLRWCVSLPPACVHDYGRVQRVRCLPLRCTLLVHQNVPMCPSLRRQLRTGVGVCSPRPDGHSESSKYGLTYGFAPDWLLTEQAHGGVRQV